MDTIPLTFPTQVYSNSITLWNTQSIDKSQKVTHTHANKKDNTHMKSVATTDAG